MWPGSDCELLSRCILGSRHVAFAAFASETGCASGAVRLQSEKRVPGEGALDLWDLRWPHPVNGPPRAAASNPAGWANVCNVSDTPNSAGGGTPDDRSRRGAPGVSAFIARVLEQLSPNSWLPAAFLVGNVAVLLTLKPKGWNLGLGTAINTLAGMNWGAIIVLLFALVIATIAIQAFEFELLRFFEGYWRRWRALLWWDAALIHCQSARLKRLENRMKRIQLKAAKRQRDLAISQHWPGRQATMWGMVVKVLSGAEFDEIEDPLAPELARFQWHKQLDPVSRHRLAVLGLVKDDYPKVLPILPTRLGNVMRAAEERVRLEDGQRLEGFMIRNLDRLPPTVADEFGVYRQRLDMYCAMIIVLTALAVVAGVHLVFSAAVLFWQIAIPVAYLVAIWPCYYAAIASARGLGEAVTEANFAVNEA